MIVKDLTTDVYFPDYLRVSRLGFSSGESVDGKSSTQTGTIYEAWRVTDTFVLGRRNYYKPHAILSRYFGSSGIINSWLSLFAD